ncbi:hypothetical protein [Primorskyibacter sp. 2E233]|uniref:hypothetical protein n=1 Tax=Primorskyibacter sp. 2E233 TaxID=3413431 RepID=UPI003BF562DB
MQVGEIGGPGSRYFGRMGRAWLVTFCRKSTKSCVNSPKSGTIGCHLDVRQNRQDKMDIGRLVEMILRRVIGRLVNKSVDAGLNRAAGAIGGEGAQRQAKAAQKSVRKARRAARMARRMGNL